MNIKCTCQVVLKSIVLNDGSAKFQVNRIEEVDSYEKAMRKAKSYSKKYDECEAIRIMQYDGVEKLGGGSFWSTSKHIFRNGESCSSEYYSQEMNN